MSSASSESTGVLVLALSFIFEEHEVTEEDSGHQEGLGLGIRRARREGDEEVIGVGEQRGGAALGSLLEDTDGLLLAGDSDLEVDGLALSAGPLGEEEAALAAIGGDRVDEAFVAPVLLGGLTGLVPVDLKGG